MIHFLSIAFLIALSGCEEVIDPIMIETHKGQTLFFNGDIYTVNEVQQWAEAVLVEDGVIIFVGNEEEARKKAHQNAKMVDLRGRMMMPGIHDVHMHPLEASSENFAFELNATTNNAENYLPSIERALGQNPGDGWLLGWGHDLHTLLEARRNPLEMLDELATDRPVMIMEQTSHSFWVNSKALEVARITKGTQNPEGGIIMKEENGELNGILIDNAGDVVLEMALQPTTSTLQKDYEGLLYFGLPELAKHGITSISEARTYWKRDYHKTWRRIANEKKLTARVNLGLWAYPTEEDASQLAMLKSLYDNSNGLLRINQIKLYSDGIVHNTTAAMHHDYEIDLFEEATNNGLNYFTQERLRTYIQELEPVGFDFHIHAIGNRGIHESLNAIEQAGTNKGRHRLTHLEIVDPADYNRFQQLNVTADCQVAGDFTQPHHWGENKEFIGANLSNNIVPIKSLSEAGARLTLSSDWDVSTVNPFVGMEHAITREPQAISLEEAVKAYTINGAYVMRQEDKVGSIEIRKEADLIVLDRNIFDIAPNRVGKTRVLETYLSGNLVYPR